MTRRRFLGRAVRTRLLMTSFLVPVVASLSLSGALAVDLETGVDQPASPAPAFDARWNGWTSIDGVWNSDTEGYGEIAVFAPFAQQWNSLFFGEVRGRFFEDRLLAGNVALGARKMTDSGFNLGAWVGLDVFRSISDNTFGQVSGGIEALSTYFDFRANGYLPFSDAQTAAAGAADVILTGPDGDRRGEIFMIGGEEVAAYGGDVEAGFRLPFGNSIGHLGIYGGGYYYDHDDIDEAVTGGMARAELAVNDVIGSGSRITANYRYSDDNIIGANHRVGGQIRIALGAASALSSQTQQLQRMIDPLVRNSNIYIGQSERESVEDGYTEVRFDRVAYSDTDGELTTDIGEGANTLLVLDGTTPNSETALQAEQTLAGGGSLLRVRGTDTGSVSYASIPGTRPTVTNSQSSGYALTLGGYNTVNGVDVVSQIPDTGQINSVNLGGIDGSGGGSGLDVMAIVDTTVTVSMAGTGDDGGIDEAGGAGILDSALYGINFAGANQMWIENSVVDVSMTGTGGAGGAGSAGGSDSFGGFGGDGVRDSMLYGVDLSGASNVWLAGTTVNASMTGYGENGGEAGDATDSSNGGFGGDGVRDSMLYGVDLSGTSNVWLIGTTMNATMTGTGGDAGEAGVSSLSFAGADGIGIFQSTLYGIDLSGNASNIWLNATTVNATITGTGSANFGGAVGRGIEVGRLYGIALNGATDVTLTSTTVNAVMTGNGGNSVLGSSAGDAVMESRLYGIDLSDSSDVWLSGTTVNAIMTGTGGNSADGVATASFAGGGEGVQGSMLYGIDLSTASNIVLNGTTVTATIIGVGGSGGAGGTGGDGVLDGTLYGIDLSGAFDTELSDTTVNATMTGTGGAGGNSGASSADGAGGIGIRLGNLYGISLNSAVDVTLDNTSVTAMQTGIGGKAGDGDTGSDGGIGIIETFAYVIDLFGASNVWQNNTTVLATMTGTGGNGSNGDLGGDGGIGISSNSGLYGITVSGATATSLADTTVDAVMTGNGGDGGVGTTTSGSGAIGIDGSSEFYWINPFPVAAGVTLIDPTVFLGDGEVSNPGDSPP